MAITWKKLAYEDDVVLKSDHTKAAHDALDIDADTVDTKHFTDIQSDAQGRVDTHAEDTSTHGVSGDVVGTSDTQTLTNKRVTPRVTSITSSAQPAINTDDCDCFSITALAENITSMSANLSGTPTNFQKLIIRIKDNGTARSITWGASFAAKGVDLPTTTVAGKLLSVGFIYDTVASVWGCVAVAQEE